MFALSPPIMARNFEITIGPCGSRLVGVQSDWRTGHKVCNLWPLNPMESVKWASEILEINQRTGIWWKNQCSSNWSRFSATEIITSADQVSNIPFFRKSPRALPAQIVLKSPTNHIGKTVKRTLLLSIKTIKEQLSFPW